MCFGKNRSNLQLQINIVFFNFFTKFNFGAYIMFKFMRISIIYFLEIKWSSIKLQSFIACFLLSLIKKKQDILFIKVYNIRKKSIS